MPIDHFFMPMMAVMMLMAAILSSTVLGGPFNVGTNFNERTYTAPDQPPMESVMVEGTIERLQEKDRKLVINVKDVATTYELSTTVTVFKDKAASDLTMLAPGDFAVLTLASSGSKVVVRIEAVSSR
ncbi:hypothetical protein SH661x_004018 [Planctomicrobium sp. SH661]|uniref:hypothetical protein n=1 Tax=Planctomicrobium sp. SH661 TaxID=3448124 RepID=UPI003F5C4E60